MMKQEDKIYIAGHTGLVGSAIVKVLKAQGYTNIIGRTHSELDLCDARAVEDFFVKERPEYVFLAAAKVGGIIANNRYRAEFIRDNLMIQSNVIHSAWEYDVKKLLFLGSTCIYPRDCPQPMKEEYLLTAPLEYTNEPYAIAKIAGIKMCESYNLQYGTNFLSVMPTNLYGPNDNFDLEKSHVLPALMRKIYLGHCLETGNWKSLRADMQHMPIEGVKGDDSEKEILAILAKYGISPDNGKVRVEVWGSGKPLREFLWSEEMAEACIYIMKNVNFADAVRWNDGKDVRNTHINIGTGREISIQKLANLITATIGYKGDLFFNTDMPDGSLRKLTDPSKIHGLGWKHKVDIETGITKLYQWYVSQSGINN
ncbi:MAG TPA: GDP-L-fucose synthase [Bacteroidales bacterium]|nr:GDP-L-fucose synthase [Bacteroidales bacterium]